MENTGTRHNKRRNHRSDRGKKGRKDSASGNLEDLKRILGELKGETLKDKALAFMEKAKDLSFKVGGVRMNQVRNFYDQFVRLSERSTGGVDSSDLKVAFSLLKAQAAYAERRARDRQIGFNKACGYLLTWLCDFALEEIDASEEKKKEHNAEEISDDNDLKAKRVSLPTGVGQRVYYSRVCFEAFVGYLKAN